MLPSSPRSGGGPVGLPDEGNRRDWFPGVRGRRAASGRIHLVTLFIAFTLGVAEVEEEPAQYRDRIRHE